MKEPPEPDFFVGVDNVYDGIEDYKKILLTRSRITRIFLDMQHRDNLQLYKAGYDVVLSEFGWNHIRLLNVFLNRGAAKQQENVLTSYQPQPDSTISRFPNVFRFPIV